MESNTQWTLLYTGSDFQIDLLRNQLENAGVVVLVKKPTLEVVYGGNTTTGGTRLYTPNDQMDIAQPIADIFEENQKKN